MNENSYPTANPYYRNKWSGNNPFFIKDNAILAIKFPTLLFLTPQSSSIPTSSPQQQFVIHRANQPIPLLNIPDPSDLRLSSHRHPKNVGTVPRLLLPIGHLERKTLPG